MPQIGEILGGRDHTTVMYGCEKITDILERDERLRRQDYADQGAALRICQDPALPDFLDIYSHACHCGGMDDCPSLRLFYELCLRRIFPQRVARRRLARVQESSTFLGLSSAGGQGSISNILREM